ncbi:aldehyde dehydrogenase, partial [Mycolicibacterium gilvum]|nr:aldehyde dehydrogenase [Mycolicibacterium gilvum]
MSAPAPVRHLIAGQWRPGHGEALRSVNPAHPAVVVAEGSAAVAADVDTAVGAAAA